MLLLDPPPEVIAGVAVFRDHASKSHFHYVPAAPRVARTADGPELSFVRYREDPSKPLAAGVAHRMGGGFLSFTVELAVERETLDAVRAALRERGVDEPVLSPVVFTSGRAVLATVAAHVPAAGEPAPRAPEVFEVILGDTTPSLEGTERALFALALPDEAAAALGAALLRMPGPTPLGVRYELEYAGLRPALDVKVRADKKRISDSLKAGFAAGVTYQGWSLDVDVGKTVQKLVQDGAIEVEVTRFSDEAEWRQSADAALEWFKQDLIQRFFAPALSPEGGERATGEAILNAVKAIGADSLASVIKNPELVDKVSRAAGVSPETVKQFSAGGGGQGNGMPFSLRLGFQYRELHQEEEGTLVADYAVTAAEKRIAAPQGLLDALTADVDASKVIRDVTLGGDFLRRLDVLVSPVGDLAAFGVSSMLVDLTHPADAPDGTVTRTLEFTPERSAAQAFSVWLDDPNAGSYRYRARLVFAPDGPLAGGGAQVEGPWEVTATRVLALSLSRFVRRVDVRVMAGEIDLAEVAEVAVELRTVTDAARALSTTVRLSKDHLADTWSLRVAPDATVAFESRCTWSLASGVRVTYGWEPVDGTSCVVSGPWRSARDLRLVPLLPDEFVDAAVTLRWRDAGRERARDESFSPGDARPRTVRLRSTELTFPKLTAEVMVTLGDRMPFLGEETEVRDPVLVVTDRAQRVRRIQTTLLAPARLADAGVAAVRVQLIDANDEATVIDQVLFTESRRGPLGLLATIGADGKLAYRYRVIRYTPQGVAATSAAVTSSAPEILVAAKAP